MPSADGTDLLQDDGETTLDDDGYEEMSDGDSDCDCCGCELPPCPLDVPQTGSPLRLICNTMPGAFCVCFKGIVGAACLDLGTSSDGTHYYGTFVPGSMHAVAMGFISGGFPVITFSDSHIDSLGTIRVYSDSDCTMMLGEISLGITATFDTSTGNVRIKIVSSGGFNFGESTFDEDGNPVTWAHEVDWDGLLFDSGDITPDEFDCLHQITATVDNTLTDDPSATTSSTTDDDIIDTISGNLGKLGTMLIKVCPTRPVCTYCNGMCISTDATFTLKINTLTVSPFQTVNFPTAVEQAAAMEGATYSGIWTIIGGVPGMRFAVDIPGRGTFGGAVTCSGATGDDRRFDVSCAFVAIQGSFTCAPTSQSNKCDFNDSSAESGTYNASADIYSKIDVELSISNNTCCLLGGTGTTCSDTDDGGCTGTCTEDDGI